jgi:phosphatidate cytidylyltransferase
VLLLAAAAFAWLRADPTAGRANAFFLLAIVWATDIAAYLTGRAAKGPKLAPRISPAKTWSGAAGGIAAAICTGLITAAITATSLPHAAAIAAALSIIAQAGDLGESAVKRRFGVKDSSRLIPGHGGALDRLDSTLAVSLAAALLVILRGRGVVLWA